MTDLCPLIEVDPEMAALIAADVDRQRTHIQAPENSARTVDRVVVPGAQGGPLNSHIAAKAVCFKEASTPEFRECAHRIVADAAAPADLLAVEAVRVVSGGTGSHMFLIDLRSVDEDLDGGDSARELDPVGITANAGGIPDDPRPPLRPSG